MAGEGDDVCPVCKSDRYLTPKMVLMVSPCYHLLCDSCVYRLFLSGSAPCPQCGTILRKSAFHVPVFEDLRVEKECRIRKNVARCLNKREEDFESLRAYNDYLEQIEVMIFNLVNDIDVEETMAQLETYRRENAGLIKRNLDLEEEERRRIAQEKIQQEEARLLREKELLAEIAEEQRALAEKQASMVDELINPLSGKPPSQQNPRLKAPSSRSSQTDLKEKFPGLIGLKRPNKQKEATLNSFNPLETVEYELPAISSSQVQELEKFYGKEIGKQMRAGGFNIDFAVYFLNCMTSL